MTAIKDIIDLTAELRNKVKDRQLAAEITRIQTLISALQSEHFTIIEKNTALLSENSDLKKQISNYKSESKSFEINQKEKFHNILLDDMQIEILKLLYKQSNLETEDIQQFFKIDLEAIKFHLEELRSFNMVYNSTQISDDFFTYEHWYIVQEGRRYLIENKLIS